MKFANVLIKLSVIVVCVSFLVVPTTVFALWGEEKEASKVSPKAKKADIEAKLAEGDVDAAMSDMEDVIASDDLKGIARWATLELMGNAQKRNQLPQVIESLETKSARNPKNIELQKAIAEGYTKLRNWNKVISLYEKMEKMEGADAAVSIRLVDYYILGGQYNKAIARLEPIVEDNPNDKYNMDRLLNAYVGAGDRGKALAMFRKRIAAQPDSVGLHADYAQALQDFGMYRDSLREWQKAAELDPNNQIFVRKQTEVRELMSER